MTRKHVSAIRRRAPPLLGAGRASGVGGLSLDELITLWRLVRGGLAIADAMPVAGLKLHGATARASVETFDRMISSPLPVATPIRCGGCGALVTEIPCLACGGRTESYKLPDKRA